MAKKEPGHDFLPALAGDMTKLAHQARWLRDCIQELHGQGDKAVCSVPLDTATVLALTPPLTASLMRIVKQIESEQGRQRGRRSGRPRKPGKPAPEA